MTRPRARCGSEGGVATVEFVAGMSFVVALLLGLLQVVAFAYAGNVARHAAHEAARTAAQLGSEEGDGAAVARAVLADALGGTSRAYRVSVRRAEVTAVEIAGPAPRLVPFLPSLTVHASARAATEGVRR